jgi:hypothetical protein
MTIEKASRNTPDQMDLPFVCLAILGRQPAHPRCAFRLNQRTRRHQMGPAQSDAVDIQDAARHRSAG